MFGTFLELIQQIIRQRKIPECCYMIPRVMFINFYISESREYRGDSPLLPKKRFTQNSETKANVLFSESESRSVVSNSLRSHGLYSPWNSPGQNTGVSSHCLLQTKDLSKPRIKPRSVALQVDSLPAESLGKPKNIGMGSLSLLQQIFPTQESNQGLLHCRWILYQLSYEGSPI